MKVVLKLPRISMNMEEGTITAWRCKVGESFQEGNVLYEIETEKSTLEVEAPCAGSLLEVIAEEGADVEVGAPVCRIEQAQ
jgi:pyruvate/2-oxoglutarate dehydrogenase complex dihydrolipoamide acyltransferase (E2) component